MEELLLPLLLMQKYNGEYYFEIRIIQKYEK